MVDDPEPVWMWLMRADVYDGIVSAVEEFYADRSLWGHLKRFGWRLRWFVSERMFNK